jgi:hypothetical protein
MSFQGRVGLKVTGLIEINASLSAIQREEPQVKMQIHKDASTFFVLKAKEKVHKISGDLARSIKVDSITPQQAIVSANMPYAKKEEERKGNRRIAPGTPHAYMKPAAADTASQMPIIIKKDFDSLLARHKTR